MRKNKKISLIIIILSFLAAAAVFFSLYKQPTSVEEIAQKNHAKNDAPQNRDGVDSSPSNSVSAPATAKPAAPILQKSSGNNGPVPPGAIIEFVCRTNSAVDCTVVLTSKTTGKSVNLEQKRTQNDKQPYYASFWTWTSEKGSWSVVAKATNGSLTTDSAPQILEVE